MTVFVVKGFEHTLGVDLCKAAGVNADMVRRMVLDLDIGAPGKLYLELYPDVSILDVSLANSGVEINYAP